MISSQVPSPKASEILLLELERAKLRSSSSCLASCSGAASVGKLKEEKSIKKLFQKETNKWNPKKSIGLSAYLTCFPKVALVPRKPFLDAKEVLVPHKPFLLNHSWDLIMPLIISKYASR